MRSYPPSLAGLAVVGVLAGCDAAPDVSVGEPHELAPAPDAPHGAQTSDPTPIAVRSVPPIDTSNRAAVVSAFNTYYNVVMPEPGFTGSTDSCQPGAISRAFQEWTIARINYYRAMAGVPGDAMLYPANGQQQAAALIMAANGKVSHAPTGWLCANTTGGLSGASGSNLAVGGHPDLTPTYLQDTGAVNDEVGHRRGLLHSRAKSFAYGQAVTPKGGWGAAFRGVEKEANVAVSVPKGIAWPRGYFPIWLLPTHGLTSEGERWSFGLPGTPDFSKATVSMTVNGAPLAVTRRTPISGPGDHTLVWELPIGHKPVKNSVYNVKIEGVEGAPQKSYSYDVIPIDPTEEAPATPRVAIGASLRSGSRDVFALGANNTLQYKKAWTPGAADALNGRFEDLGGNLSGPPTPVSWAPGRLDVFGRGTDGSLQHRPWAATPGWPWSSLGWGLASPPSIVSWGPNRLDVFMIDADGALNTKLWNGTAWAPSATGWTRLGGTLRGTLAAVAWGPNRLDVFGISSGDGSLQHISWTGSQWSAWANLGGVFTSPPAAVAWGPNRLDIVGLGTDGRMWQRSWTGSTWQWTQLGSIVFTGTPTIVSSGPNKLNIFALQQSDKVMHHRAFANGAWGEWEPLGGVFTSVATALAHPDGTLDVFGLGTDKALYHKGYTSSRWAPAWSRLGGAFTP